MYEEWRAKRIRKCGASPGGDGAMPSVAHQYHGTPSRDGEVQADRRSGHSVQELLQQTLPFACLHQQIHRRGGALPGREGKGKQEDCTQHH